MDLKQIRPGRWGARRVGGAGAALLALVLTAGLSAWGDQNASPSPLAVPGPAVVSIAWTQLPLQGQQVLQQIHQGGPFRYEKDGTVFGNRERRLPGEKRGYYREYTVPTPGLKHRGARRIVCGGIKPRTPEACYYTEDHYGSFRLIVQ
jgi:ribonuclease T1